MKRSRIEQLLSEARENERGYSGLSGSFSADVLEKAKQLQALARAHWRWLLAGSLAAVAIAMVLAYGLGRTASEEMSTSPPPLSLFGESGGELKIAP